MKAFKVNLKVVTFGNIVGFQGIWLFGRLVFFEVIALNSEVVLCEFNVILLREMNDFDVNISDW